MKLNIAAKLFITMLSACALVLAVNGIAGRLSFERTFLDYLNEHGMLRMEQITPRLASEYKRHGDWEFLRDKPKAFLDIARPQAMNEKVLWDQPPPLSDQTGIILRLGNLCITRIQA